MQIQTPVRMAADSLEDRRQNVVEWFTTLTQYPRDEDEQHTRTRRFVRAGKLPLAWVGSNRGEGYDTYARVCGVGEFREYLLADRDEIRQRIATREQSEMPRNMASDGSKGQWRANKHHDLVALRWLLDGNDEGVYGKQSYGPDATYELAYQDGIVYRSGDFIAVDCANQWVVSKIEGFREDTTGTIRAILEADGASPALECVTPELADWMKQIINQGYGAPFRAAEGDSVHDGEVEWVGDRPVLKGDIVQANTDEHGIVYGKVLATKYHGMMDEPTVKLRTNIMRDPPTYENGYARDLYGIPVSDVAHVEQCANVSALKPEYQA